MWEMEMEGKTGGLIGIMAGERKCGEAFRGRGTEARSVWVKC
jgi:hypothetical protein